MPARLMAAIRAAERCLLAGTMLAMSILYFINVIIREFHPKLATELAWIDEATLFLLAWLVFVGLGLTLERRRHIAMTAWLDTLSPRVAWALHKIINLSGIVVCLLLARFSFDFTVFTYRSSQISPTLGFSMIGLYMPLPIGFALLTLRYVLEFVGYQDRFAIDNATAEH